jgi:lipopolysaccharide heptosyltransferase II
MINNWHTCKNILCIRPDNMGDLIMSGPAIRALKESFACKITILTSSAAAGIAKLMPEIDDVMIFDAPWVKSNIEPEVKIFNEIIHQINLRQFDGAVIFTVYSQNPLPTVMLAYLSGIPNRLAYCRENPYQLLTDWVPDKEPYTLIKHQVRRDLDLVASIGAKALNEQLALHVNVTLKDQIFQKLSASGVDTEKPWLIFHPGVSELKREYPPERWISAARQLIKDTGYQILLTGTATEKQLCESIQKKTGSKSINAAGLFNMEEFVGLISQSPVVVSVNTGTVHIGAAVGTPIVVLYALTNPQHTPWKVPCKILPYHIPAWAQSKNEVIRHVHRFLSGEDAPLPDEQTISCAVKNLLVTTR